MSSRKDRAKVAEETIEILERGYYETGSGATVNLETDLSIAIENTVLYRPDELEQLDPDNSPGEDISVTVTNETTLEAARSFTEAGHDNPFVLNFASARNPGGGFLSGSGAQEESLARKSGLYACISQIDEYYRKNELSATGLYTDHMIYSPRVPVFRDKNDRLLESPYLVSILTAPAVNRSAVKTNQPELLSEIMAVMDRRINKVLKVAAVNNHDSLVLGAWGCGVFGNNSEEIAGLFRKNLFSEDDNSFGFQEVVFAILDKSPAKNTFTAFKNVLEKQLRN